MVWKKREQNVRPEVCGGLENKRVSGKNDVKDLLLRVDLEPHALGLRRVLDVLVHASRAEPVLEALVGGPGLGRVLLPVLDLQVDGLVLLVVGAGAADAGEDVEGELSVGLLVLDLGALVGGLGGRVVADLVLEGEGQAALEQEGVEAGPHDAAVQAQGRVEGRAEVAHLLELLPDPALAQAGLVVVQEYGPVVGVVAQRGPGGLGGQHARLHGVVRALDLGQVDEPGRVADQRASREGDLWYGLEAALDERAGAVRDALAALEHRGIQRVLLHLLELLVRAHPRVRVVERRDQPDGHQVVAKVVHPAAAVRVVGQGVSHRVCDVALLELLGLHLPDLLDAEAVRLRVRLAAQVELLDDLLAQAAVAALSEHGHAGVELHASLERVLWLSTPADTQVVGGDAQDAPVRLVQHLAGAEAGVDLDADLLGALAQPLCELVQAQDVVALVVHLRRGGQGHGHGLGQEAHVVVGGGGGAVEARLVVLGQPVWEEFLDGVGLDDGAGEDVGADLASLLEE